MSLPPASPLEPDFARRPGPPPWLFGILAISGAVSPYLFIVMPLMLRREGIGVDTIGSISALASLPWTFCVLLAPLIDVLVARRTWFWTLNFAASFLLYSAVRLPHANHLALITALLVVANSLVAVSFVALSGLMAVLTPASAHGRAGGWFQAGSLGSVQLIGGLGLWLLQTYSLQAAAVGLALAGFLPALAVFVLREPARPLAPNPALLRTLTRELGVLLRQRATWIGFLFFLSPFGAGAAINLFSAIGQDFQASESLVAWVVGFGGVIPIVLGTLAGGHLCDRFDRRRVCIGAGLLGALSAAVMLVAPAVPLTFVLGVSLYMAMNGCTWAAFSALALELSGSEPASAGTRMTLFAAAMSASPAYMTWLDGKGYAARGLTGLLSVDAGASLLVGLALIWLLAAAKSSSSAMAPSAA